MAIVTPTYNNALGLKRLYNSINIQNFKGFTWIISDDGSVDDTRNTVEIISRTSEFELLYIYNENGGKCRAINRAYSSFPQFDFYMIIDSDEMVIDGALERIFKKAIEYHNDSRVGAIYCWRDINNSALNKIRYDNRPPGDCLQTIYDRMRKDNTYGDGAIGYYGRFLKEYRFREFTNEKFIGEITILLEAAKKKYLDVIVYVDFAVCKSMYSDSGMTSEGRKLRLKNPYGMIYYSWLMQSKLMRNKAVNIKYSISAAVYAYKNRISRADLINSGICPSAIKKWAILPGIFIGTYWSIRNKK